MLFGKRSSSYRIDMCSGPIVPRLLLFTIPLILSSVLQLLFNAADVVVVGKYAGDNSLAAVGSVGPLINLLVSLFIGLSIGSNVLASRYYGSGDDAQMTRTVHTSMLVKLYFRLYCLGMPASMVYNFGSAILRAVGDTKRPMYYLTAAGIVNVILNLLFVISFHMDVAGVAIATVISQIISAALVVRCLMKESGSIKFDPRKMSIDKDTLFRIIRIGLPASFQSMLFSISNVIIQSSVNGFGATVVAGNSAAQNIEGFVYVSMNSFYQACISFVSANVGARKYERINRILIRSEICVVITGMLLGGSAYLFAYKLLSLYTDSPTVMDAGFVRVGYVCLPYFLCGMIDVMVGALRGLGYAILPMIVSLVGACGLRLLWIFTFFRLPVFHEPRYLYVTYPVSWTVTFLTHVICYIIVKRKFDRQHVSKRLD